MHLLCVEELNCSGSFHVVSNRQKRKQDTTRIYCIFTTDLFHMFSVSKRVHEMGLRESAKSLKIPSLIKLSLYCMYVVFNVRTELGVKVELLRLNCKITCSSNFKMINQSFEIRRWFSLVKSLLPKLNDKTLSKSWSWMDLGVWFAVLLKALQY